MKLSSTNVHCLRVFFKDIPDSQINNEKAWFKVTIIQGYLFCLLDLDMITWFDYENIMKAANKKANMLY